MNNERLIELCRQGEKEALSILYQRYHDKMIRVCLFYVPDKQTAQDLLHDSFIIIFTSIGSLHNPDKLESWIRTIVKNICLRYINQCNASPTISLADVEETEVPVDETRPMPSYADLMKLVEQLPDGYRKIFKLSVVEGMTHKEISSALGIATHSSSSQLFRAKVILKKLIAQYGLLMFMASILPLSIWFILGDKTSRKTEHPEMSGKEDGNAKAKATGDSIRRSYSSDAPKRHPVAAVLDTVHHEAPSETTATASPSPENIKDKPDTHTDERKKAERRYTPNFIPSRKDKSRWNIAIAYSGGETYNRMKHSVIDSDISTGGPEEIEVKEKVHHYAPVVLSVALHKDISKRWGIETGIRYTLLKSKFTTLREFRSEKTQSINYVGIPLKGTFQLWKQGNISIYGTTGATLEIPLKATTRETITGKDYPTVKKQSLSLPLQWSVDASAGFQYQITPSVGIYAEPSLHYYFNPKGSPNTIRTQKPLDISIPIGIRFSW